MAKDFTVGAKGARGRTRSSFAIGAQAILTRLTKVRVVWCSWLARSTCLLDWWTIKAVISLPDLVVNVDEYLSRRRGGESCHINVLLLSVRKMIVLSLGSEVGRKAAKKGERRTLATSSGYHMGCS